MFNKNQPMLNPVRDCLSNVGTYVLQTVDGRCTREYTAVKLYMAYHCNFCHQTQCVGAAIAMATWLSVCLSHVDVLCPNH